MADVRFTIDHHQLGLVIAAMDEWRKGAPRGETAAMLTSILDQVSLRLRKRHAERRLDYKLILPVYQALAVRRMVMFAVGVLPEGQNRHVMRLLLGDVDAKTVKYTHT